MSGTVDENGMSSELGALDMLLHRGEANPRTRSGIMALEILDTTPDWNRFRTGFENASRKVLRLRQRVVVPTLPTAAPRWVVDPDFNLDFHVRRVRVPEPGTLREVLDLAEVSLQSPLDISRPLWTATLVEGLAGGRAATLLHLSHAVTDGVGATAMFAEIYDLEREPPPRPAPPMPVPQDLTPNDLMREGFNQLPGAILGGLFGAVSGGLSVVGRVVRNPGTAVWDAVDYARSGRRVVGRAAEPSPLLRRRSLSSRSEAIEMRLADLRSAAHAAGGSINDAYLAGLCGALRRYHEALGVPVNSLPMAVPVSLRAEADPAGGNRFAGVNLAAPIAVADPGVRIQKIRKQMTSRREEAAIDLMGAVAPVLGLLPDAVLEAMTGSVIASDVQASNVPVYAGDTYIAGAKVLRQYGIGPLPGVAMMVVLVSRGGFATITARYDRASITDEDLFARCLREGFDEVLALAGDPPPRVVPSSFPDPVDDSTQVSPNGSVAF
ncbi:wax ester/triacylglycerol synthase family O-acyltransferase [Mycobacterium sp. CVI_P3]|uniref:Diacylglycerol O-acyltransferase n=1 Tax=Mycobacterium pinniadriaticum TaxID=2994102 RepID=A0ABT3SEE6_9MYCO|nr:wax ester/triacylglycerol synthase family O-acyltransferase [Mycobacterium pinniadriaticum]MCX2931466.1 wax ester/triacylglycerol synthase family O-acyltransferase [Mycobacterium pinniadriaticum]MCX2937890.1 wax ester/triacylglycerol synthase family O-acyltransferase [Mycobacterium pinniadriaticum]